MPYKYKKTYEKIFADVRGGLSTPTEAARKYKLKNLSSYYMWLKKEHPGVVKARKVRRDKTFTRGTRLVSLQEERNISTGGKIILLVGSPDDVLAAARGLL